MSSLLRTDRAALFATMGIKLKVYRSGIYSMNIQERNEGGSMRKIVIDMQNYLFADAVASAFKNSEYDIDVIRAESPQDTVELCQVYEPFVLVMEVTGYTPWRLSERLKLRDRVRELCPDCKIALMVDSNTERQAAKDIRDAKKNGLIDQFFYGSMTAEYLMDQIYAM